MLTNHARRWIDGIVKARTVAEFESLLAGKNVVAKASLAAYARYCAMPNTRGAAKKFVQKYLVTSVAHFEKTLGL